MDIKIIDGFVWLIVTRQAKEVFDSGLFELYVIFKDGSENSVHGFGSIDDAIEFALSKGLEIGIEGGFINT